MAQIQVFDGSCPGYILNTKGGLISEGILTLCQITPLSRKFEFPAHISKQLTQIFCSESNLALFCWQWDQSQNTF